MIGNARIADLIRDNKPEEITEAIAEGDFFQMQTFSDALVNLVLEDLVDREVAANAASNRHDFLIALERALKEQAVKAAELNAAPDPEEASEPEPLEDDAADEAVGAEELPRLRVAGQQ
jgi:Tfp pilus assembly ATPase PilU